MVGRTPRRGGREWFVAETRHGGLPGAYNLATTEWNAQSAGGRTVDLLTPSVSGREYGYYPTVAEGSPAAEHFCIPREPPALRGPLPSRAQGRARAGGGQPCIALSSPLHTRASCVV